MPDEALRVEGLSVRFPGAAAPAVDHVSLCIEAGERVGVVGESGSGKSMLGFALTRLTPPEAAVEADTIVIAGLDLTRPDKVALRAALGARIAYIFQEPLTALSPTRRIGDQIADVLLREGGSRAEAIARAALMLEKVRIDDARGVLKLYPHQLSGGMRQRVLIAMAFAFEPALVVADEITTAIDASVRGDILSMMREKAQDGGAAILFISHDLGVVRAFCDRLIVMYAGRVVETGPSRDVADAPAHPYTQMLVAALPTSSPARTPLPVSDKDGAFAFDAGCGFRGRCPSADGRCAQPQTLREVSPNRHVACVKA